MNTVPEKLTAEKDLCGEDHGDVYAAWLRHSLERPFDVRTSFPDDGATNRQLILSIVDSDCVPARSKIGEVIEISHFLCHPAEVRNEKTGELEESIRTVLPQPEGPPISFVAKSIIKALQKLSWATGQQLPFDPPIRAKLKLTGRAGRQVYLLERVQ